MPQSSSWVKPGSTMLVVLSSCHALVATEYSVRWETGSRRRLSNGGTVRFRVALGGIGGPTLARSGITLMHKIDGESSRLLRLGKT